MKIADLAKRMIELSGFIPGEDIKIEYTGLRPGEKLYEEVLADAETTLPTTHDRIRIAHVRQMSYEEVAAGVDNLAILSKEVRIPEMVKLMKQLVPEFKSANSVYQKFDS